MARDGAGRGEGICLPCLVLKRTVGSGEAHVEKEGTVVVGVDEVNRALGDPVDVVHFQNGAGEVWDIVLVDAHIVWCQRSTRRM